MVLEHSNEQSTYFLMGDIGYAQQEICTSWTWSWNYNMTYWDCMNSPVPDSSSNLSILFQKLIITFIIYMLVIYTLTPFVAYLLSSTVLRPQWDSIQIDELGLGLYKDICSDTLFIFKDAM